MQIVKPLTDGEVERIHEASLDVLENVGLRVEHEELQRRLRDAGATVNEASGNVRIPASLMCELLTKLTPSHTIAHMDGSEDVVQTGSRHFLSSLILPRVIDLETLRPRRPTMEDLRRNNIVAQKLDRIKGIYRMEEPTVEEGMSSSCLASLEEYILNNGKHLIMFGTTPELMEHYFAIGEIISETQNIPLSKLISSSCPISAPLKVHPFYGEYMLRSCEAGFPVFGTISPSAGATAPRSFAGSLVVGNTENLFMAAVSQIIKPGIPFLYMYSPTVMDMRTGKDRFYSLDRCLARTALAQMSKFYHVPFLSDCGGSMPPRYDIQTGAESITAMLAAYSVGPAWMGAIGTYENGLAYSAEMLLIHAAWFEAAAFLDRGIRVDEERLAIESIKRNGPGGNYLMEDLTIKMLREDEFFDNDLLDMTCGESGTPIIQRAREKVDEMTEEFESPLPHNLQENLRRYFHDQRKKLDS